MTLEMGPPIDLFLLIFGGMYINIKSFPYLKYVSIFFYSSEGINIEYWSTVKEIGKSFANLYYRKLKFVFFCTISACHANDNYPCLKNGSAVLENLGYGTTSESLLIDYIGLLVLILIGHLLGFFGIRRFVIRQGFY